MAEDLTPSFDLLAEELVQDPDLDVVLSDTGLHVRGHLFAYPEGDGLIVDLPQRRAADLIEREVAAAVHDGRTTPQGVWVRIVDPQDWRELAAEAHQFVGEPAVGRDS